MAPYPRTEQEKIRAGEYNPPPSADPVRTHACPPLGSRDTTPSTGHCSRCYSISMLQRPIIFGPRTADRAERTRGRDPPPATRQHPAGTEGSGPPRRIAPPGPGIGPDGRMRYSRCLMHRSRHRHHGSREPKFIENACCVPDSGTRPARAPGPRGLRAARLSRSLQADRDLRQLPWMGRLRRLRPLRELSARTDRRGT